MCALTLIVHARELNINRRKRELKHAQEVYGKRNQVILAL